MLSNVVNFEADGRLPLKHTHPIFDLIPLHPGIHPPNWVTISAIGCAAHVQGSPNFCSIRLRVSWAPHSNLHLCLALALVSRHRMCRGDRTPPDSHPRCWKTITHGQYGTQPLEQFLSIRLGAKHCLISPYHHAHRILTQIAQKIAPSMIEPPAMRQVTVPAFRKIFYAEAI